MFSSSHPDIIVVGASAGGVEPLRKLVSAFPPAMDAAIFVVLHTHAAAESLLPQILSRVSALPAESARDGTLFETGRIYVAPPDRQLLLHDGSLRVVRGPKENLHRPSIDVLFRSAAMGYGHRVIGVLLSGADDDGTAGMLAIKRLGGVTVAQQPAESLYPDMPESAVRTVCPDFILPVTEIGKTLVALVTRQLQIPEKQVMPDRADRSFGQEEGKAIDVALMGTPSAFSCPTCNGTLWELHDGELVRYQCRVGHAFNPESMMEAESDAVERALWTAVRVLEESASVSRRIAEKNEILRERLHSKAVEREEHARVIRNLLIEGTA
ncbi:MAG TPA: chemotaxis protein CheB [Bryobacteraceae bacterium]|nr:chemotaxis protein CheB [Bryobacteraceae bacterium]